ncbi:glycoside hydrolase family 65 protein [Microbacterium ureisolvens]|uniref:Glycoside hydrolase family 65 protein n=1 Tax=Microbacterium ureisolvens TaxID=2781186 RepID=A0ABS7I2J6_9MICO|nr:glycosyl hydrolase family 65 protein [Microbacterium ureisolvens]MBW9110713.1 glycoside hydrolase family 65 protein [Microbacterium ureisolvens]
MPEISPFDVSPWGIGWSGWEPSRQARRESVFSLSNGHIGWRGTLDEGDPCETPGSYLNGLFEHHPMPYAEDGYGYPERGETMVNAPDGKVIRLLVDDEPFDIREGRLESHEQHLDFRAGTLRREVRWTSPSGATVRVESTRLVSLTHRAIAAIDYRVTALSGPLEVTVLSEIVANEPLPEVHPDERVMDPLRHPYEPVDRAVTASGATLLHRTKRSRIGVAVAMDHVVSEAPSSIDTEASDDVARTTVTARLTEGGSIRVVKMVGHEWSGDLTDAALRDRVDAAVATAARLGWDALAREQRDCLDDFWEAADVELDGDTRLQQAVRFALFQVLQSAARADVRSIPGKGLTGPGYEGHTFWDAETFVLPVLTYTAPGAAAHALRWRHSTLDTARERAGQLHLAGAAFPWRTISGRECSGYWPAGTVAFHINADIAGAVMRHVRTTGDEEFEREVGLEVLVETARLWVSLGYRDAHGVFHLDGITGPDEYSALVDDNTFTNLAAQRNLRGAAQAARRHSARARELGVRDDEVGEWEVIADAMAVPYDEVRRVHQQAAGYTDLERWDFEATSPDQYPLQNHFPYFDLYRKQVLKQADLVLALQLFHEAFTAEETARAFAYYEGLTVRDSSLSASTQAVVAAWVGQSELAIEYLTEASTIDLNDLRDDVDDGLHIAALGGVWTAVVSGLGGMKNGPDGLEFCPRLAAPITRLSFGIRTGGRMLRVEVSGHTASYTLSGGPPLPIRHFGAAVELHAGKPTPLPIPPAPDPGPRPSQPKGRSPEEVRAVKGD